MELPENIREKIWRIADGIPLRLGNMAIRIADGKLLVTGWTSTIHFENLHKHKMLEELNDLKTNFQLLSDSYQELENMKSGNNLELEYHLAYDDGGKASIGLCSEIGGLVYWYIR